ncbi:hypothetical protein [Pyxidicoccus xibeiensis]|uniref:hypothetical protein n=1 Tax=Pyxidicoccus xibeiensis TaxID=2906759 RepID=UPI0020A7115A|nr:hypothetical protein [Pyxidicoccus xibeiensis]MCP3140044.1 hypothetical protein [Pyxidicoccus xibeiensis]
MRRPLPPLAAALVTLLATLPACQPGEPEPPPPGPTPCAPNPCTEPHRTVCTAVDDTTHQCGCDAGYRLRAGQCVEIPPTCPGLEQRPGGDALEFDDCPERAIDLAPSSQVLEGRTLFPELDKDHFRLQVREGALYRVRAESLMTHALDILTEDGLRTVTGHHGAVQVAVTHFKAPSSAPLLARLISRDPLGDGAYRLLFEELPPDDHGDDENRASPLLPSSPPFQGTFEWHQDVDAFTFVPTAGHHYGVTCEANDGRVCEQFLSPQGRRPAPAAIWSRQELRIEALDATPYVVLVRAHAFLPYPYTLHLRDLGPDDHPDGSSNGTPVAPGGPALTGTLLLETDVDAFTFTAQAGHVYQLDCADQRGRLRVSLRDAAGNLVGRQAPSNDIFYAETQTDGPHTLQLSPRLTWLTGTYSCRLTDQGLDDHGDTWELATPMTAAEVSGELQYDGDVDFASARTTPGVDYRVTLTAGSVERVGLRITTSRGALLGTGTAGTTPVDITFRANTETTHFGLSSADDFPKMGTWSLRLEEAGAQPLP